jgi:16S rRNA (guanine527-N7)-methyltransferase
MPNSPDRRPGVKRETPPGGDAELLERYCALVAAAPISLTAVREPVELRRLLVEDALTALPLLHRLGPELVVDVGSGSGSPGIPLAIATGLTVVLLESRSPKAAFLRGAVEQLGVACPVTHRTAEEHGREAGRDRYDLALARALAPPPVALELCLPLVRPGGHVLLWVANVDAAETGEVACQMAAEIGPATATGGARALLLVRKLGPTPERFPRRPGVARRRPLRAVRSSA